MAAILGAFLLDGARCLVWCVIFHALAPRVGRALRGAVPVRLRKAA